MAAERECDVRIVVTDLVTGESETKDLPPDDYLVICGAERYVANTQVYPRTGSHVLTIKRAEAGDGR